MESSKYPKLRFDLASITPTKSVGDSVPIVLQSCTALSTFTA
jgi:hypothetical protein